jgi:acetylornithine deacetylase/succinyl-diaminopimelate desuccinylase-like protein
MIALKREGVIPERDIVLTLTAGEESDLDNGVKWLIANRRDLVDAEYVLGLDAGGADMKDGHVLAFAVQSAEKVYLDLELVARGPGGHSSTPNGRTPIDRLAQALDRLSRHAFPVMINPVVRTFFERRAPLRGGDEGAAMAALATEPNDLRAQNVLIRDPALNALMRTTCIATMLRGGTAPNAIPQEVGATVNCRLMPGHSQEVVVRSLRQAIGDSSIDIRVVVASVASEASIPTAAQLQMFERMLGPEYTTVPVIPYMESGATDALWFRNIGIPTFGVAGFFLSDEEWDRLHGRDERMSLAGFRQLIGHTERMLREVARQ